MNDQPSDQLRAALDVVPLGVVVTNEVGDVVFRNRQAASLADPRTADVLVATAVAELMAAAAYGVPQARTLELRGPPARTLEVSVQPLADDIPVLPGRRVGTVAVIADVSERHQLDAVRRDFVANVSHELRTPVGALGLLAETLAGEEDPAVSKRLADRIWFEAERVSRVIDDLLDLSRIEVEGLTRKAPVSIDDVIGAAVDRVLALASRHHVELNLTTRPPDMARDQVTVMGDESQLVSAVTNLLDNAIKYSEAGSAIDVAVGVTAGPGVEWVDIVVRDRGIGIPRRDHERIFERFYRVDQARSRGTGGTGLGLAIVRHVVTNHGGEVRVRSREGEGSSFTLRLPCHSEPRPSGTARMGE